MSDTLMSATLTNLEWRGCACEAPVDAILDADAACCNRRESRREFGRIRPSLRVSSQHLIKQWDWLVFRSMLPSLCYCPAR